MMLHGDGRSITDRFSSPWLSSGCWPHSNTLQDTTPTKGPLSKNVIPQRGKRDSPLIECLSDEDDTLTAIDFLNIDFKEIYECFLLVIIK